MNNAYKACEQERNDLVFSAWHGPRSLPLLQDRRDAGRAAQAHGGGVD